MSMFIVVCTVNRAWRECSSSSLFVSFACLWIHHSLVFSKFQLGNSDFTGRKKPLNMLILVLQHHPAKKKRIELVTKAIIWPNFKKTSPTSTGISPTSTGISPTSTDISPTSTGADIQLIAEIMSIPVRLVVCSRKTAIWCFFTCHVRSRISVFNCKRYSLIV